LELQRRRLVFDHHRDILHAPAEARRNATKGLFNNLVEVRCPHDDYVSWTRYLNFWCHTLVKRMQLGLGLCVALAAVVFM
jgi:hypothetical protein